MTKETYVALLTRWSFDPQIMVILLAVGVLYWIGTGKVARFPSS